MSDQLEQRIRAAFAPPARTPEQLRQQAIADQRALMARHFADEHGNCGRCVELMPVVYPNTTRTFPCGPWQLAAEMVARLGGTVTG